MSAAAAFTPGWCTENEHLAALVRSSGVPVLTVRPDGLLTWWNQAAEEAYGYTAVEARTRAFSVLFPPDCHETAASAMSLVMSSGRPRQLQCPQIRRDGTTFEALITISPIRTAEGGCSLFVRDMTEVEAASKRLRTLVYEKDVLLREVHHRVKNNLQVISSLLSLQHGFVKDIKVRGVLRDCENRIFAMSLIHEHLYGTDNLSHVELTRYLGDLVSHLTASAHRSDIQVRYLPCEEPVAVTADVAIPCGLILNELLSNAIKHAFPTAGGKIKIEVGRSAGTLRIVVSDDGVGLPANYNWETAPSLGLRIVRTLARQLGGYAGCAAKNETTFWVEFSLLSTSHLPASAGKLPGQT